MIAWALDALIGSTLLMLLVLAVRGPVAKAFGAGWAYALWLLPLLRLVMPPIDLFGDIASALPQRTVILIPAAGEAAASLPASAGPGQWVPFLLALWAGGAAVFMLWQQSAYSALLLSLGRNGRPTQPSTFGGIRVVASEAVDGPIAIGFFNRRIAVPLDFGTRYSPAEQRLALEHELVHHRRGDIWWNAAALAVLTVNWWNPIAHFAFRAFRMDQELACDAAVARRTDSTGRCDYARALVKSASRPGQIAACPLNSADQLKRRLRMMNAHRATRARALGGSVAVAALLVGGMALSSPGFAREEAAPARVLVASAAMADPILSRRDIATLREKCGDGGAGLAIESSDSSSSIRCGGRDIDDPEVKAIVKKALTGAKRQVAAAKLDAAEAAEVAEAVAEAKVELGKVDIERSLEQARISVAEARAQMASVNVEHIKAQAIASAMASVRAHGPAMAGPRGPIRVPHIRIPHIKVPHVSGEAISAEIQAEVAAALAEARAELEAVKLERELERADAELERELDRIE